jgi:hypothetical protein
MGNMLAYLYEFHFIYYVCTSALWELVVLASLWFHGVNIFSRKNVVAILDDFLGKKSQETCRDMTVPNFSVQCAVK